jgi:hypothetical protein
MLYDALILFSNILIISKNAIVKTGLVFSFEDFGELAE